MSLYELQRHLFERLNLHDVDGSRVRLQDYDLTPQERAFVEGSNLLGMHEAGVHPVLIQAFGRLRRLSTDDIKRQLRRLTPPERREVPWRTSR